MIKRPYLLTILAVSCLMQPALAQRSKVTTAWGYINSKDYDKARDAINIAITNDDTKNEAKTWFYRGEAYQGLYSTTEASLKQADKNAEAHKAYNTYIETNSDLKEAAESFIKCIELDNKDAFPEAKDNLVTLTLLLFNDGINCYNDKQYAASFDRLEEFEKAYSALGDDKKKIDAAFAGTNPPTDMNEVKLYMAGCAIQLGQHDKAKQILQELADAKFANQAVYINLFRYYLNDKDTAKAIGVLDQGMSALPDNLKGGVLIEKLKILVKQGKNTEAISVAEDAINHDPKNLSLYNALGRMYAEQKNYDKALETYHKAQAIDPNNFGIASGIGIVEFNQGVDKYNMSVNAKNSGEADKYLADAKTIWKGALKDLEGSLSMPRTSADHDDLKGTYDALSQIYYKLNDPANGKKYRDLSKQM